MPDEDGLPMPFEEALEKDEGVITLAIKADIDPEDVREQPIVEQDVKAPLSIDYAFKIGVSKIKLDD